jgi:hypothetical protein
LLPPRSDRPVIDLTHERIRRRPVLGGLITEYGFWNPTGRMRFRQGQRCGGV